MRRAVVLYATLVIILSTALAAGTVLAFLVSVRAGGDVSRDRVAARAGAWSGVQAVMAELQEQRPSLLSGGTPTLTDEWTLLEDPDAPGAGLVVRVVPIGDQTLISENAKLDANSATQEMLAALESIGAGGAARIVQGRSTRLYDDVGSIPITMEDSETLLTAFAVDPQVASGFAGEQGGLEVGAGDTRRSLANDWDEAMGGELERLLGGEVRACVQGLMSEDGRASDVAGVIGTFRRRSLNPETWGVLLDAYAPDETEFSFGRVDINRASAEVIACLPGLDESSAQQVVFQRDRIDDAVRRSWAWPVTEGIVSEEAFQQAAPWITTRSLVWRVRIECGRPGGSDDEDAEARLRDRIALEAVIDLSAEEARVAWMRDVTHLAHAAAVREDLRPEADPFEDPTEEEDPFASEIESDSPERGPTRDVRPRPPARADAPSERPTAPSAPVRGRIGRWNPAGTEPAG